MSHVASDSLVGGLPERNETGEGLNSDMVRLAGGRLGDVLRDAGDNATMMRVVMNAMTPFDM